MKTKLWKVEKKNSTILLTPTYVSFGSEYRDCIYRSTDKHAREIFGPGRVVKSWSYGTIEIPIDTTEEQARDLYYSVLSDVNAEKERFNKIKNALEGIDESIVQLEKVKDILEGNED